MVPLGNCSNLELNYQAVHAIIRSGGCRFFSHNPAILFRSLAPRLRAIIPFDFLNFALFDPEIGKIKMYMWECAEWPDEPLEVAPEEAAVGWVWQNQSVLAFDDLRGEKRFEVGLRYLHNRQLRSYCVLPLTTPNERLGALGFGSNRSKGFGSHDALFLRRVAEMVALCMDTSLATVALSSAPLVSAAAANLSGPSAGEFDSFSPRDLELLQQIAATLVSLVEQVREDRPPTLEVRTAPNMLQMIQTGAFSTPPFKQHSFEARSLLKANQDADFTSFGEPESLQEWEQLLTVYSNATQVGLCIFDREFRYVAINDMLAKMNGLAPDEHLGKNLREVLGAFAEPVENDIGTVLATGQEVMNRQISGFLPGRSELGHWIGHYIPIKNSSGVITQIGAIVIEITEQKNLEASFRGISEKLKFEEKRTQVMTELGRLLTGRWDLRQAFPKISAYLRRLLYQEYAAIFLADEKSGQLVRQAIDFPLQKFVSTHMESSVPVDLNQNTLREHTPVILTKDDLEKLDSGAAKYLLSEGLQALCCIPLIRPKGSLGVFVLGSTRSAAFKDDDLVLLNQVAAHLAIALENDGAAHQLEQLRTQLGREKIYRQPDAQSSFPGIIGESSALQKALSRIEVVAPSDATVLLLGETGTGKGLAARALHQRSKRKDQNFVVLNCAAIPTGLLESELFGHEKGAFTGAICQKIGRLELAHKGTLFLDEVGEIPYELQSKLLRVLQDHEFERLGSVKTIKVDLRLVAATNRDLAKSVLDREFRSDLFYRLNVFPIRLPSLRERREDISILVRHFVGKFAIKMNRVIENIPGDTMMAIVNYSWPGNVRELENFVERSVILTEGTVLWAPLAELHAESSISGSLSLEYSEREHIIRILRETGGLISGPSGAAQRLGLKRTTLQSKIERLAITPGDYSDPES
jgi:formate hydrogenlyase transcriptional activator